MKNLKKLVLFVFIIINLCCFASQSSLDLKKEKPQKPTLSNRRALTTAEKIILAKEWLAVATMPFALVGMVPNKSTLELLPYLGFGLLCSLGIISTIHSQRDNKKLSTIQKLILATSMMLNTFMIYAVNESVLAKPDIFVEKNINLIVKSINLIINNALYTVPALLTLNYAYNILQKDIKEAGVKAKNLAKDATSKIRNTFRNLFQSKHPVIKLK
jgi:hypothetical protein